MKTIIGVISFLLLHYGSPPKIQEKRLNDIIVKESTLKEVKEKFPEGYMHKKKVKRRRLVGHAMYQGHICVPIYQKKQRYMLRRYYSKDSTVCFTFHKKELAKISVEKIEGFEFNGVVFRENDTFARLDSIVDTGKYFPYDGKYVKMINNIYFMSDHNYTENRDSLGTQVAIRKIIIM